MASPNHGFVYGGDCSDTPATAPAVNPGSARIEQLFKAWFSSQRLVTEPSAFDGRSDYKAFQSACTRCRPSGAAPGRARLRTSGG